MFDPVTLQTAFAQMVGVRQSNVPGLPQLPSTLTNSLSGFYVDDKNPLAATENMYYSGPIFEPSFFNSWVSGNNYAINIPVNYQGTLYISLQAITNDTIPPPNDATNWALYTPFISWITQKTKQAVSNLFAEVVRKKKLSYMAKAIRERVQLYRGGGSIHEPIVKQGRAVGFMILPQQAEGLWVYLDQVGFQGTESETNLKFYLYHCDSLAALGNWNPATVAQTFTWNDLTSPNCIMKYLAQNTSGVYYFVYYEDDLTGMAISKKWDCQSMPCIGCDGVDLSLFNIWTRYISIRNIYVPSSAINSDRTLFDTTKIVYDTITNWGMNLSITVRCNLTDYIIYNKYLFADALAMQMCKEFIEAVAKGYQIGPNPQQTKISAIADLDRKNSAAWIHSYDDAVEALNIDMSGFSSACLPCDKSKEVKFFSI